MTQGAGNPGDRARAHPEERFAPLAQVLDPDAATRESAGEATTGSAQGQRQKTLYRYGNSTLAFFLFEAGAKMREQRAMGTVFIQVPRGRLNVQAHDQRHDLPARRVLVMSPGVPHDVVAEEASQMLLAVCLQPATPPEPHR